MGIREDRKLLKSLKRQVDEYNRRIRFHEERIELEQDCLEIRLKDIENLEREMKEKYGRL